MKSLMEIVKCPVFNYEGYYEIFRQYAKEAPEWINNAEEAFIENGFFDGLCLTHPFKSKNEHIDVRFDEDTLKNPSETIGYKKARDVMDLRIMTETGNLGSIILYMINPHSAQLESYIEGMKKAWEEENYKTRIIIIVPYSA